MIEVRVEKPAFKMSDILINLTYYSMSVMYAKLEKLSI